MTGWSRDRFLSFAPVWIRGTSRDARRMGINIKYNGRNYNRRRSIKRGAILSGEKNVSGQTVEPARFSTAAAVLAGRPYTTSGWVPCLVVWPGFCHLRLVRMCKYLHGAVVRTSWNVAHIRPDLRCYVYPRLRWFRFFHRWWSVRMTFQTGRYVLRRNVLVLHFSVGYLSNCTHDRRPIWK